ncbi:cupin domain-containing protein [Luteococcus peritonei]|uniref:Cupin domain-containing protein n=1 Tax=Luteococcus peritonei TaxID=88874 RepID=A0ABW4RT73_9ACTN
MEQESDPGAEDRVFTDPTEGQVEQSAQRRRAGTDQGTATEVAEITGRSTTRGGRPGATTVLDVDTAKIVAFEFETGDELREHAAHHPVLIQVLRGRVDFELPDRTVHLVPGQVLHLTPMLRHAVTALEPTTLTVTMLLPH